MKIIHYIGSLHFGGIEKLVLDLSNEQVKAGHEICIAVGNLKGEFLEVFQKNNLEIIDFELTSGFSLNFKKCNKILKVFKSKEIVHLHAFHPIFLFVFLFFRRKIIYTEHGNFAFGRKKKAKDKVSQFLRKLFFIFYKVEICCNSDFTKSNVEKNFYKGKRLHTVKNGIQLELKINENLVLELKKQFENKFIIGTTCRLVKVKKLDRLIDVFNIYIEKNLNSILLIVGDGPEKLNLLAKIKELNLENKVYLLGYQSEVQNFQKIFDVSIIPSQNESFGLVALESYVLNKPVLVFQDGGGLVEIVSMQNKADVCKDYSDMLKRIEHYRNNIFNLNPSILTTFSAQKMASEYQKIYLKCVE